MNPLSGTGRLAARPQIWPLLAAFSLVLLSIGAAPSAWAEIRASNIRIGVHPGKTRVVVDLSGAVEAQIFTLAEPYRLVIDLPQIEWALPEGKPLDGAGVVERFRFGDFETGTGRIVFDLGGPVEVAGKFTLPADGDKPWRLVVDLAAISGEKFADTAQKRVAAVPVPQPRKPPPAPAPRRAEAKRVVVIDAGHGGIDPGATGLSGVYEKAVVLEYADELRRQLEATGRYEVLMTRDKDVFMSLRARAEASVAANADLFISLHVNTDGSGSTSGFSAYTLSQKASDEEVAALAAKENKSDIMAGMHLEQYSDEVANILIDFAQSKTNEMSVQFARDFMVREVGRETKLLSRPWRAAGFAVLKAANVPSVLIEMGYVSNPEEERKLLSESYRAQLCAAMARAVNGYFTTVNEARRP